MDKKPKTLTEAYKIVYETEASEARLDKISKLHKLGAKMSDAEAAYTVIHDMLNGSDVNKEDYIALGRELKDGGMKRDDYSLETLQKALEYAKQDGWEFEISPIMDQLGGPLGYKQDYEREEYQDDEHRGWPGDGTGTDDLADYNEREADDYYNESKSLNHAYNKVVEEAKEQTYTIRRTPYTKSARPHEQRRAIYNATEDELIKQLEAKGRASTADETKQEFNNIAQKCHTLLTGGGAGEYSGIKINDKERQVLTQIARLILTI